MSTITTVKSKMPKSKTGKIIFWSVVGGLVIFAGLKVKKYLSDNALKKKADDDAAAAALAAKTPADRELAAELAKTAAGTKTVGSGFPLQRSSVGNKVKILQAALVKANVNALPRYGIDGILGSETEGALKAQGWPIVVDQNTYNKITGAGTSYVYK